MIEQSETIAKLAKALLGAQKDVGHPTRNAVNPHFRNQYADLTSVIDTVTPVFNEHGITVTQFLVGSQLVTQLLHESGEYLRSSVELPLDRKGPQAFGSALTYLRRYTLQAIAGVNAENDDDAEGATSRSNEGTKNKSKDW